jgi:hypothetical protein
MLRKLEAFVLFLAMMLAIILEGAFVYWMSEHPVVFAPAHSSLNVVGEWTGLALPQGWLIGALLVLAYRITVMFMCPKTNNEVWRNRQSFLRLWRWTIALIAMQGLVLFIDRAAVS